MEATSPEIEKVEKQIKVLEEKRAVLVAKELAKRNLRPDGFMLVCQRCDSKETDERSNYCKECFTDVLKEMLEGKESPKTMLNIYKTV